MADNEVIIEISARLDKAEKALSDLGKKAKDTGDKVEKDLSEKLSKSFKKTAIAITAAGVAIAAVFAKGIKEAAGQEDAINSLNQSLANAGTYSEEASIKFQELANSIQRTTTVGDDAVLNLAALARNFTQTNEQAEKLTMAAIELSAATGKDLNTSVELLGKTFSGSAGRLAQMIPSLQNVSKESLKTGIAIDTVLSRFGGSAEAKTRTFSGAFQQLSNVIGDVFEEIGNLIIKSPGLVAAFNYISKAAVNLGNNIKIVGETGFFDSLLKSGLDFVLFLGRNLLPGLEIVFNIINKIGQAMGAVAGFVVESLTGNFKGAFMALNEELSASLDGVFDVSMSERFVSFTQGLKTAVNNAKPIVADLRNSIQSVQPVIDGISFKSFKEAFNDASTQISITAESLAQTLKQSLVTTTSSAFSAFGGALAKGENAFKAFGKSILSSLGQLLINFGTTLITIGFGLSTVPFLFGLQGPAAIAAGVAATIAGGALLAFGGGGGGGASAPSGSQTQTSSSLSSQPIGESVSSLQPTEPQQKGTSIVVNVQGNILDRRQTGLEIADIINETFSTNGITIARGAVV